MNYTAAVTNKSFIAVRDSFPSWAGHHRPGVHPYAAFLQDVQKPARVMSGASISRSVKPPQMWMRGFV